MNDLLVGSDWWFLERLEYEGALLIIEVAEGIVASTSEDVTIEGASTIEGAAPIEITPQSRHVRLEFGHVLTYQVTDESYAAAETGETEGKVLASHTGSAYLKHVLEQSLIHDLVDEPVRHFSLSLADDVIDVITTSTPTISRLPAK